MKHRVLRWIITLLLVFGAAFLIFKFVINAPKASYEQPLTPVRISKPQRRTVEQSVMLTGYVQATAMIPVVPFVSGTINEYLAKEGDYVQDSELMAVIDFEPYELQLAQADAIYTASLATFERVKGLYSGGAATQQQYDEAKAQADAYKAQLELARLQLDYCNVKAPAGGTVLVANSAQNSVAEAGSPLFVIADITKLKIVLDVPEAYFDLFYGAKDTIRANVSREGKTTDAAIDTIAPYVDPKSKTFRVSLSLENAEGFVPGMFVNVRIVYNTVENALTLDWKVMNNDGSVYMYSEETETAVYEKPEVLASDSQGFAIDSKYDDIWFITDGQGTVLDGRKVRVVE